MILIHSLCLLVRPWNGAALLALVVLALLEHGLPRRPHCALLDLPDAAVDRDLGQLLCGGG